MKRLTSQMKNNSGFTLVEVLISMLILSIIVTSATTAFVYATRISKDNKLGMTAINLANDSVEYIRSLKFADVGTKIVIGATVIYGDPSGDIPQTTTKLVDGIEYIINTTISWEEQGGWDLGDTDWDYKSVKVSVVPKGMEGDQTVTKEIETYVTRDSTQPALTGANISLRIIRGWKVVPGTKLPVSNAIVKLTTGPSAPRQVPTSSGGVARFINLLPGNYIVKIDPTNLGMILRPDQAPTSSMSITTTWTKEFEVEYPCGLRITLKDLEGNPIIMNPSSSGTLTMGVPFGTTINKNFTSSDIDTQGKLPLNFISGLWPVGVGYTGAYTVTNVSIAKCQYFGSYVVEGASETLWSGKFDGPGTIKDITCYFGTIPVTPNDINTNWVDGSSLIRTGAGSYIALDSEGVNIVRGKFITGDTHDTIIMQSNTMANYNASSIYFENTGSVTNPGLYIRNRSNLVLNTGMVVFRGKVEIQNNSNPSYLGKITLSTTHEDGSLAPSIEGSLIGETAGINYGKLYLAEPMVIGGSTILEPGGYYYYNGLTLPNNTSELIPITKDNYVVN